MSQYESEPFILDDIQDSEEDCAYPEPQSVDDPWWSGSRSDW